MNEPHFLLPNDALRPEEPDDFFREQAAALGSAGFSTSLVSDAVLKGRKRLRGIPAGRSVIYRGWMLKADEYGSLVNAVEQAGGTPLTSAAEYLAAHHLPNWYPLIPEFTPETRVYPPEADLSRELRALGWGAFFVKDF